MHRKIVSNSYELNYQLISQWLDIKVFNRFLKNDSLTSSDIEKSIEILISKRQNLKKGIKVYQHKGGVLDLLGEMDNRAEINKIDSVISLLSAYRDNKLFQLINDGADLNSINKLLKKGSILPTDTKIAINRLIKKKLILEESVVSYRRKGGASDLLGEMDNRAEINKIDSVISLLRKYGDKKLLQLVKEGLGFQIDSVKLKGPLSIADTEISINRLIKKKLILEESVVTYRRKGGASGMLGDMDNRAKIEEIDLIINQLREYN